MRGIVFRGDCTVDFMSVPDPTPGPGEVVLEIKASGMCGSDLHTYRRPRDPSQQPFIMGHEPCGVIVAVGAGVVSPDARIGARVMVHHYQGCNVCPDCRSGWPQMCRVVPVVVHSINDHGAHAPYMKVRADTLVPLDERLSFAAGAAISCGTGTAWGAFERMGITGRDSIAVFGQGPVGLSATLIAKAQGARVIALDVDENRLRTAKEFGADHVIDSRKGDVPARIRELTGGQGASMALETAGVKAAGQDAVLSVRPWGTVCLVGLGAELSVSLAQVLRQQLRILTSWTMSIQGQRACADFIIDRGIQIDRIFTDHWKLEQAGEAYSTFNRQSGGKGVFLM